MLFCISVHDHSESRRPCGINPVEDVVQLEVEIFRKHAQMSKTKQADLSPPVDGGTTWIRTRDTWIFNPLLYHLSYGTSRRPQMYVKLEDSATNLIREFEVAGIWSVSEFHLTRQLYNCGSVNVKTDEIKKNIDENEYERSNYLSGVCER